MNENHPYRQEIQRICRLLRQTAEIARETSLTGSLEKGAPRAGQQYNRVAQRLEQMEAVPPGFFPPVTEAASLDEVGIASLQLASYLDDTEESGGKTEAEAPLFGSLVISHLGSLEELETLRALGRSLREKSDRLRQQGTEETLKPQSEAGQDRGKAEQKAGQGKSPLEP